jgi:tRNA modification GTPase
MNDSGNKPCYGSDDLIAAFATTPGNSALTLIRCSGKGSIEALAPVFSAPEKILNAKTHTVIHGWIVRVSEKIDEVVVSVFRSPKSYTGEDSLDICCHGGFAAGKAVMDALKTAAAPGAMAFRDALPGEFTFRAFMNGKLDLTKSESVMEMVSAKTETGRRHAVSRLSGSLFEEINEIKKMLVEVLSAAEIYLDYSEDEVTADTEEAAGKLPKQDIALRALEKLKKLSASWQLERLYQEGVTVVIAGPPNSGKSSLFNAMLKEDRSIVTETPGTTRDWIEAWVNIEGIPVRLVDTAGLRETADDAERIGVERSRQFLEAADLVLLIGDSHHYHLWCSEKSPDTTYSVGDCHLLVWNKVDIMPLSEQAREMGAIGVSAKTGEGLDQLYAAISTAIKGSQQAAAQQAAAQIAAAVGTERQKKLVDAACAALEEALSLDVTLDLIAPLLRDAVNSLGEITGEVSTADILEEMFSKFCVGK